jgi:hypothetical protein
VSVFSHARGSFWLTLYASTTIIPMLLGALFIGVFISGASLSLAPDAFASPQDKEAVLEQELKQRTVTVNSQAASNVTDLERSIKGVRGDCLTRTLRRYFVIKE